MHLFGSSETLEEVRLASKSCQACPLWENATQTVFGEGPEDAELMLVGEQPGDKEDIIGRPFVGPAGNMLRSALAKAGIADDQVYVTNAVKHFKWEAKGARRIHKRPNNREVQACYPWLQKELKIVQPRLVVCLGATAAQALLGKGFKVTQQRREFFQMEAGYTVMATIHPSALLRMDADQKEAEVARFVEDLKHASAFLQQSPGSRATLL